MQVIAHRGASAYAPEHSFAAYDLALAMGAGALELDLRAAADGELLVHHDPLHPGAEALALGEVLAAYGRATHYWIELKDARPTAERDLVAALARHRVRDRVTIQAFDRASLRRIGRLDRMLPLVALHREGPNPERMRRRVARTAGAGGIGPHLGSVDARVVQAAHCRGLTVQPYTVNDPAEMERFVALGVDGIFTDAPDLLREVVDARIRTGSPGTSTWSGSRRPGRAGVWLSRSARTGGRFSRTP
jgi:glycerophosphoryl diester phosphodiesterase